MLGLMMGVDSGHCLSKQQNKCSSLSPKPNFWAVHWSLR